MDTLHQPFSNELHVRTGLAEWFLTLPSDDVARTAVHDGLGHILSLKPETGLGFQKLPNHHNESRYTSQILQACLNSLLFLLVTQYSTSGVSSKGVRLGARHLVSVTDPGVAHRSEKGQVVVLSHTDCLPTRPTAVSLAA